MSSNNLRNNELEFTPTFGTQHFAHVAFQSLCMILSIWKLCLWPLFVNNYFR